LVRGKVEAEFADLGEQSLKNMPGHCAFCRVGSSSAVNQPISPAAALPLPDKPEPRAEGGQSRGIVQTQKGAAGFPRLFDSDPGINRLPADN
jgi:hypothetical protein